ncbi:MAG: type II secretion system protein M [Proteobacteria bacterium]|nr:type II secretion system protein M [Pseudomonadota bacterium]
MKKLFNIKLKRREKIVVSIGCVIALIILSYRVILWAGVVRTETKDRVAAMMMLLERQNGMISGKEDIKGRLEAATNEINILEKKLLASVKPAIAAAELQKAINDMTMPLKLEINSQKVLAPVDQDIYMAIPVEIGFMSSTLALRKLLMHIKASGLLLSVSEIKIRVKNIRNPKEILVTMTVMGFTRKESGKTLTYRQTN